MRFAEGKSSPAEKYAKKPDIAGRLAVIAVPPVVAGETIMYNGHRLPGVILCFLFDIWKGTWSSATWPESRGCAA